jgi:hypothetical protein
MYFQDTAWISKSLKCSILKWKGRDSNPRPRHYELRVQLMPLVYQGKYHAEHSAAAFPALLFAGVASIGERKNRHSTVTLLCTDEVAALA